MVVGKVPDSGAQLSAFIHFLETGKLGPLNLELSIEEVYHILGKPNHSYRPFEGTDQDHLLNLHYKNLVITFYDEELSIYILQFQNGLKSTRGGLPNQLKVDWVSEVSNMTFNEFTKLLKTSGIRCEKLVSDDTEGHQIRFPGSGVEVNFDLGIRDGIYQIDCSRMGPDNRQFEPMW